MKQRLVLAALLAATLSSPARAQVIAEPAPPPFPDPKKFAHGFFATGELGALVFLGRAGRYAGAGPMVGVRVGWDILRFLAVQAHVAGASSDANLPPPTVGQTFQTYLFTGEARVSLPLRRWSVFAEGGGGAGVLSNNVLQSVGVTHGSQASVAVTAGGGVDYHTLNRHFSLGLDGDWVWLANFTNAHALSINGYLRYTH